jgi:hypothetical protein
MLSRIARRLLAGSSKAPAAASTLESLETRRLFATSEVFIIANKIKVKNLFDDNGVSINQSLLTVRFSENISIADASKVRMIGYVVNPVGGAQRKVTVGVSEVTRDATFPNIITFKTNSLSPKSGRIIIDAGGIKDARNDDVVQNVQPPKGQNKERFTLARRAFRPTDVTLFPTYVEPTGRNGNTASSDIPEATVTSSFTTFMQRKVTAGLITDAQRQQAINLYNNATVRGIVPNANLRAALASLVGTVGEPAIDSMINGDNPTGKPWTVIDFSSETRNNTLVAETLLRTDTNRLRTLFKEEYRGEPFQALAGYIAHETLHTDFNAGQQEEIIANVVENMIYAQHVLGFRGWVFSNTQLTQQGNAELMALLNSGQQVFPRVGLLAARNLNPGNKVFHNGTTNDVSFEAFIRRQYVERNFGDFNSAGNATWQKMYTLITGRTDTATFDRTTLSRIDQSQQIVTDRNAIRLAGFLGLTNWVA